MKSTLNNMFVDLLMLFALLIVGSQELYADGVLNGDFEQANNWNYSTNNAAWSGQYDATVFHTGTRSYKLTWPSSGNGGIGDYSEINQVITVPAASKYYELDCYVKDDYAGGRRDNLVYKQILIDGDVVWKNSIRGSGDWFHVLVDVTPQLSGKSQATITLRANHIKTVRTNSLNTSMMLNTSLTAGGVYLGYYSSSSYEWQALTVTSPDAWECFSGTKRISHAELTDQSGNPIPFKIWVYPWQIIGSVWIDDVKYTVVPDEMNSKFEGGAGSLPDNWYADYWGAKIPVWTTEDYFSSTKSVKISSSTPLDAGGVWSDWIAVNPGDQLYLSMSLKTVLSAGQVYLGASWNNSTYTWAASGTSPSTWSELGGTITVPAGVTRARVWIYPYLFTGAIYVDDAYCRITPTNQNSSFELGQGMPDNWVRDSYGSDIVEQVTDKVYSGLKAIKITNTIPLDAGGIWSSGNYATFNTDSQPLQAVNVWWDDVKITVDGDTTIETRRANIFNHLGTYENPAMGVPVDVPAMINRLVDAHVTDCNYLINPLHDYSWTGLPNFLAAAKNNNIRVWVALTPHTEYFAMPFGWNYLPDDQDFDITSDDNNDNGDNADDWATQIGLLSLTYPNLVGVYIDDFSGCETTADFTMRFATTLHNINPNVAFMPCVYHYQRADINKIRQYIDGVVLPIRWDYGSTITTQINETRASLGPYKSMVTMIYGDGRFTADYVSTQLQAAHANSNSDGLQVLQPWDGGTPNDRSNVMKALYAEWGNKVSNGNMELGSNNTPSSWSAYGPGTLLWDASVSHSSVRSLKIANSSAMYSGWLGSQIDFVPPYPTTLRLGGWAKANSVDANALFALDFKIVYDDNSLEWFYYPTTFNNGTHSWQNVDITHTFTKPVKSVVPYCILYYGAGTVWFDDVYVLKP